MDKGYNILKNLNISKNLISEFKNKTDLKLLLVITLFGIILRLYQLGSESIWLDEGTSVNIAQQSLNTILFSHKDFAHPPLYYAILHFVTMISNSEFFVRLPSAIFGILSIPLAYSVGKHFFGSKEGLIAAFLLSISVIHINYSQEGRSYALMVLLTLLTVYFFQNAYNKNNKIMWAGFTFSAILLVYTHFFGFFVMIAISMFYFVNEFDMNTYKFKSTIKNKFALVSSIIFLIGGLPMILWVLNEMGYATGGKTWGMAQDGFFTVIAQNFSSYSPTLTKLYLLLLILGLGTSFFNNRKSLSLLSVWFFLPVVAGYFLSNSMPFQPRYLLFTLPAFLILISRGATGVANFVFPVKNINQKKKSNSHELKNKINYRNQMLTIFIVLLIIGVLSYAPLINYYTTPQKNDWRTTAPYLESLTRPGDAVSPLPGYMVKPLKYYYDNTSDGTILVSPPYSESEMSEFVAGYNRVWFLVTWDISAANPDGSALRWLQNNATFVNQVTGIYIFTAPKM